MESCQPRISIGLPVYNGARYLREAIESILAQTFTDFELIISDNASTDSTPEICQEYAAQDRRIRYCRNPHNIGASQNHNRVFELSIGEYFKWAGHDDICQSEYLERCVEVLDSQPSVVLCYSKSVIIDESSQIIGEVFDNLHLISPHPYQRYKKYHDYFREPTWCNAANGLIRADILRTTALIGSYPASDEVMLGELALLGEFYEIPEYLFLRREHPCRLTRAYKNQKQLAVEFDPANQNRILLLTWQQLRGHLAYINRVSMSWQEKAYCYLELRQWIYRKKRALVTDLIQSAIALVKRFMFPQTLSSKFKNLT